MGLQYINICIFFIFYDFILIKLIKIMKIEGKFLFKKYELINKVQKD